MIAAHGGRRRQVTPGDCDADLSIAVAASDGAPRDSMHSRSAHQAVYLCAETFRRKLRVELVHDGAVLPEGSELLWDSDAAHSSQTSNDGDQR